MADNSTKTDVQIACEAIDAKRTRQNVLWDYRDGSHPLVYSSAKLKEIFSTIDARFSENWCGVVVDSELDRLDLDPVSVPDDDTLTETLREIWSSSGLDADLYHIHESVLTVGEAFLIVWPNEDGEVEAYWNDSRLCHAEYEPENPRRVRFATKCWYDEIEGKLYLTMYYPDRLEYYIADSVTGSEVRESTSVGQSVSGIQSILTAQWRTREPNAENPFGVVPVFHFRNNRRRILGELTNVIEIQDAVNKLMADMLIAAEFGAFKQRYVISATGVDELVNAPNIIWDIPAAGPGEPTPVIGEFSATDINNYLGAISKLASDIGMISRTPRIYFFQGGEPSGESLKTMEGPLVQKCRRLIKALTPVWRQVCEFMLMLEGSEDVDISKIQVPYRSPETILPFTTAQIRQLSRAAGIPLVTVLREEGWPPEKIDQMLKDMKAEVEMNAEFQSAMMASAQTQFDQGEGEMPPEGVGGRRMTQAPAPPANDRGPAPAQQPQNGEVA